MDLSDEVSEVLISSVCEYGWFGECWGDVFVGVQDRPMFVNDALDGR